MLGIILYRNNSVVYCFSESANAAGVDLKLHIIPVMDTLLIGIFQVYQDGMLLAQPVFLRGKLVVIPVHNMQQPVIAHRYGVLLSFKGRVNLLPETFSGIDAFLEAGCTAQEAMDQSAVFPAPFTDGKKQLVRQKPAKLYECLFLFTMGLVAPFVKGFGDDHF